MKRTTNHGFTLVELLVASGILIAIMAAYLDTYRFLFSSAQQNRAFSLALTACISKMEEISSHNFCSIITDYGMNGTPGNTFDITGLTGRGVIQVSATNMSWTEATVAAEWSTRSGFAAMVYDNKMWVTGGAGAPGEGEVGDVSRDIWYSTCGVNWTLVTAATNYPLRYLHSCIVFDNKMWVMGGYDGVVPSAYLNDVWYSTNGVNWIQAPAVGHWTPRGSHTSVVYDNQMWVLGGYGYNGPYRNDVWYSTNGVNWTQASAVGHWTPRSLHASVVYDNKMWVMGGYDGGDYLNDVWYSTNGVNWTCRTTSALWSVRAGHTALVYDNKMWVLGGQTSGSGYLHDVWYSVDGANWTQATASAGWSDWWSARQGHCSLAYDNKIWVMGGGWGTFGGGHKNDVWDSTGYGRVLEVWIRASFETPAGRIIGEDKSFDGNFDVATEDANGNDIYDTPVQIRALISEKEGGIFGPSAMRRTTRDESQGTTGGFTLMEMMVTLTIFTVILGIAYTALSLNDIYRDNVGIQVELYRKNKQIHDAIAQELTLSAMSKVKTDTSLCSQNSPCFQTPIGVDGNYDIIWGADTNSNYWIHYTLDGTNFLREICDDDFSTVSQRIIGSGVIAIAFQFQTNTAIINSTIQKRTIGGRNINLSSQSEVYLRND